MRVFGIDPGSERTGYGCVETDGRRHHLVTCGAIAAPAGDSFPRRLARIHSELSARLAECRPDCVVVENLFYANNARSALKLGHARGVAILAAVEAGCEVLEYTPAEVKRAVVGYGRADKRQVQQMIKLLLGLDKVPVATRRGRRAGSGDLPRALGHWGSGPGIRDPGSEAHDSDTKDDAEVLASVSPGVALPDVCPRSEPCIPKPGSRIPSPESPKMIAFLRGRVLNKQPTRVIVDVGGVGYEVHVPLSTFYEIGDDGAEISLRVYTHVREETLQLFGFLTDLERQVFERLIGISGIGPKLAIAVLSGMDSREVIAAIQRADVARLTGIPGIGKKTAERIVLELKDRLMQIEVPVAAGAIPETSTDDRLRADLLSALQNLGYHRPQAERAIDAALTASPDSGFQDALRAALRELMRAVGSRQ